VSGHLGAGAAAPSPWRSGNPQPTADGYGVVAPLAMATTHGALVTMGLNVVRDL
jgi:hypothetical protein